VLFGDEVGNFAVVDEVLFVLGGGFPFGGLTSRQQGLDVVKPEFGHAIVIGVGFVSGYEQAVALDQLAEARNSCADRAVDVFPVMEELLVGQACFFGDAINQLDHISVLCIARCTRGGYFTDAINFANGFLASSIGAGETLSARAATKEMLEK
jgi:hypothetical protein